MFVPKIYEATQVEQIVELMRSSPLALLLINGAADVGPSATHLPVVVESFPEDDDRDGLVGATLLGHMNRANPQWASVASSQPGLLSFSGPGSYVSPALYGYSPAAPTWNFTAVQARGTVTPLDTEDEAIEVVCATVRELEAKFGHHWDMSDSLGYFRKIVPGVGAFRFTVTEAAAMLKLGQEQEEPIRCKVRDHFAGDGCHGRQATAAWMAKVPRSPGAGRHS